MRVERIIIGVVLVGGLALQWLNAREQREALALLRGELDRVSLSVEQLQRTSSTHGSQLPALVAPGPRWTPPPVQPSQPTVVAPSDELDESLAPARPATAPFDSNAAQAHVERTFEQEASDSGWASDAQREVRESLSTLLPSTASVRGLDCRATLCRLEVDFPVETDFRSALGRPGAMGRLWKGPSLALIERDSARGSVTVIGYLVRQGHPMPTAPVSTPE
ncbi:hypothetical protein ACN469_12370 [Corallococcus terminator]